MKTRFFAVALLMIVVGFGACKKKQSDINTIATFSVNGLEYTVAGELISFTYCKYNEGVWGGETSTTTNRRPSTWPDVRHNPPNTTIEVSLSCKHAAVTTDLATAQNFENGTARITVRAQNGATKTYTVNVITSNAMGCP